MSSLLQWTIAVFCISFGCLIMGEPITTCEEEGSRLADKSSCTRYHICRGDGEGEFTTDIAICTAAKVFDMVTSSCIEVDTGYLQDPEGCTTFYGCHKARKNSEGYLRRHFECPGELRFHPTEKFCTFKTMVPDKLCNSKTSLQQILGTDVSEVAAKDTTEPTTTAATTTDVTLPADNEGSSASSSSSSSSAASESSSAAGENSTTGTRDAIDDSNNGGSATPVKLPHKAVGLTDIDRITQVIRGQLLNRRPIINNKVSQNPASGD